MNLTFVMLGTFGFGILGLCVSGAMCLPVALRSALYALLLLTGLYYFFSPGGGILNTVTTSEILNIAVAVAVTAIGFFGLDRTMLEAPRNEVNAGAMAGLSCLMIAGSVDYLLF